MRKRFAGLLFLTILFPLLGGCLPSGAYTGGVRFEVIYPSGYARDAYTRDELTPVEGTSWQLRQRKGEDGGADLEVLDSSGTVLHTWPGLGSKTLRGAFAGDGTVWLCSERWNIPHLNGYVSGKLTGSTLLLADMETGEVLFRQELEENELYLTSVDSRCYFYEPGQEEKSGYFGLFAEPRRDAWIYYRDMDNWGEPVCVQTFDFVEWPDRLPQDPVELRIRFYIQDGTVTLAMTTYEPVESGDGVWEWVERERIAVDLSCGEQAQLCSPLR